MLNAAVSRRLSYRALTFRHAMLVQVQGNTIGEGGEGREERGGTKGRGKEGKGMEGDKWRNGNEPDQVWEGIHTLAFTLEQQVFEVEQYASA